MKPSLFRKQGLDAVLEQLNEPMDDPRASKDWVSPYSSNGGTEPESLQRRSAALRRLCADSVHMLQRTATLHPGMKPRIDRHIAALQREVAKLAAVKMHEEPKILPPRDDLRSHLDEDITEETNASVKAASKSPFLRKRNT